MIWIVGYRGMLGTELVKALEASKIDYIGSDRDCDITDLSQLRNFAAGKNVSAIVNCAAYTAVDKAEDEADLAWKINEKGPANLAVLAKDLAIPLVHISTDYVFDGLGKAPYTEEDPTGPVSVYGQSKLGGEKAIQQNCTQYYILRTAWLYGEFGPNFVFTMAKLLRLKPELRVVDDQWGAPTWAADLARCILVFLTRKNIPYGVYHASGEGKITWCTFTRTIQEILLDTGVLTQTIPVQGIPSSDYPTKAKRPFWSVLAKDKLGNNTGFHFPDWRESLEKFIKTLPGEKWTI